MLTNIRPVPISGSRIINETDKNNKSLFNSIAPYSTPQKLNIWRYASAFLGKERGYAREEEGKR